MALHAMGRESGDSMALGGGKASSSSIALLQERFRQLQKMRERREEMELLKLFNEPETMTQKDYKRSGNVLVHPEMKTEHEPLKTPPYRDFWSMDSVTVGATRSHDKPDVDTSLHL
ncbi:hypothetical protein CTI12_AA577160 [Artemisia annua]|uniref:Uncharacterized protein n=1 Tax=Artemisia annua TaxID=35608 RepID=A0A2U1KPB1_ARTAN|nr:hypothetical protein CTI12_AA577160 [Artemisia annua]